MAYKGKDQNKNVPTVHVQQLALMLIRLWSKYKLVKITIFFFGPVFNSLLMK